MPAISKLTGKGQTTIPRVIRAALKIVQGDHVVWEAGTDGSATIRRVQPMEIQYLRAVEGSLGEWADEADDEAYRNL